MRKTLQSSNRICGLRQCCQKAAGTIVRRKLDERWREAAREHHRALRRDGLPHAVHHASVPEAWVYGMYIEMGTIDNEGYWLVCQDFNLLLIVMIK